MVRIDNISYSYPQASQPVFSRFSLTIDAQSWVSLIGPDRSGKTTLARLIEGLYKPDSGTITVNLTRDSGTVSVGYLGGDPGDSLVGTSVEEDVAFGLENQRVPLAEMRRRVSLALEWTGLAGMEQRLTHTLSGGEQQKLALAGMLALQARVLILDEALSMLDRPIRRSLRQLIRDLSKTQSMTVIDITQNVEEALEADRLLFLTKEGIRFDGSADEFLTWPHGARWVQSSMGLAALKQELAERGIGVGFAKEPRAVSQEILTKISR